MKRFETINVNNLIVNPENDRHGALETEENAINWLLQNKTEKMRALAKDIAITGQLFETPLVKDEKKEKSRHNRLKGSLRPHMRFPLDYRAGAVFRIAYNTVGVLCVFQGFAYNKRT